MKYCQLEIVSGRKGTPNPKNYASVIESVPDDHLVAFDIESKITSAAFKRLICITLLSRRKSRFLLCMYRLQELKNFDVLLFLLNN